MQLIEIVLAGLAVLLVARLIEPYVARALDDASQARLKTEAERAELQTRTLRSRLPGGRPGVGPIEAHLKRRRDDSRMDARDTGEEGQK